VVSRLQHVAGSPFKRLTYTEAIELLEKAVSQGHKFENSDIQWGMDMGSEHERCDADPPSVCQPPPWTAAARRWRVAATGRTPGSKQKPPKATRSR
jgi:hypothetical protein